MNKSIINDTDLIFTASKIYKQNFDKSHTKFHKAQKQFLDLLISNLTFENLVRGIKTSDLMEQMGEKSRGNLSRKLEMVSQYIDYGIPKNGYLDIEINPRYGWRDSALNIQTRDAAIENWYLFRDLSEESRTDITLTPFYKSLYEELKRVS